MSQKRARPAIRNVIAERVFKRADGREVRAELGRPRRTTNGPWVCEFRVLGVGRSKVWSVPGEDSLAALQGALMVMSVNIDGYHEEHRLTFMDGPYLALPRFDVEAMRRDIEASPDFPEVAEAIGDIWEEMTSEPLSWRS
jgi:hypothetical protein